jgi:RNA polymerase sigma factor (TIGR02999 family)
MPPDPELFPESRVGEITLLLHKLEAGDLQAADQILPLVYEELRQLAAAKMAREQPGQTLQPTALVHEAWLRLGADHQTNWQNRGHFFAAAAEAMRRILIENARRRQALRHGGGLQKVSDAEIPLEIISPVADEEILLLHEALAALERLSPRKAELVKHRYFTGLELIEAAEVMGISERTAVRDWIYARAWLFNEIKRLRDSA